MTETELWAASGAMALTGRADGPALLGTGSPATAVHDGLARLAAAGVPVLPDVRLLGERAAFMGTHRNAPWSVGGAFRVLPAADGWFGLSLSRSTDVDLIPALTEDDVDEPWASVAAWLRDRSAASAADRARLLGLPAAVVPAAPVPPVRRPVVVTRGGRRQAVARPLVVDLSALWAGPLCAHLLGLAGARVVKVESPVRPDGARRGEPRFYDLLHAGHESVAIHPTTDAAALHRLVARADVVLEASRPRALAQWGLDAEREVARGAVWISITAGGRADPMRVGFGDDVAAGAGLVAWEDGTPCPMGDALADPLTGVAAAAAAVETLADTHGALLDVSMHDVCAAAASVPRSGPTGVTPAAPTSRRPAGHAAESGQHTAAVLAETE
jgi:hypothetical protein